MDFMSTVRGYHNTHKDYHQDIIRTFEAYCDRFIEAYDDKFEGYHKCTLEEIRYLHTVCICVYAFICYMFTIRLRISTYFQITYSIVY